MREAPWPTGLIVRGIPAGFIALVCLVASAAGVRAAGPAPVSTGQQVSPEQQLAQKYAPIAMLKRQAGACDADGEPFAPAPVEVVFGDPAVALHDGAQDDRILAQAPAAADLFRGSDTLYLDLPGNPRAPGCDFERHFKQRMGTRATVAYARIATGGITGQLALQYWLYYYFNDFTNTHESDWEMIQLLFDAGSAAEALGQEPVAIALAQHGGGETAAWDDDKLQREGTHPVVYVAAGSHATHYASAVYLGWGENGTGFGCDDASGPSVRVPLEARLVPQGPPAVDGPFAWTTYRGRWGEKQPWEYNGPTGPNTKAQWTWPFSWHADLRATSIEVPTSDPLGTAPTELFCDAVAVGSFLLTRYRVYPALVLVVVGGIGLGAITLVVLGRSTLGAAWGIYTRQWRLFAVLGLMLVPVGILANGFQYLVVAYPPGELIFEVLNESPGARLAAALTVGGLQQLVGLIVVGPAVIQAVADIQAGRSPGFRRAYGVVFANLRRLAVAVLRPVIIVAALALTVVGIPWAIARTVRWLFVAQAVIVDGAGPRQAAAASAGAVAGRWWRTAGIAIFLAVVGALPGPLLGILLLVLASRSVRFVNGLSSLVYAVLLPLSVIGFTLLYRDLDRSRGVG